MSTYERKRPCGPGDHLVRESVEVMRHSVQGKNGDQYCESGFPEGMTEGDGSAGLPADGDHKRTRVPPGQVT